MEFGFILHIQFNFSLQLTNIVVLTRYVYALFHFKSATWLILCISTFMDSFLYCFYILQLAYFVGLYTSLASSYFVKYKLQQSNVSKSVQLYIIGCIGLWIYYTIWELYVILKYVTYVSLYS